MDNGGSGVGNYAISGLTLTQGVATGGLGGGIEVRSENLVLNDMVVAGNTAPSGGGTEAFVDADDIAAVAAETLLRPGAHVGAQYTLTGPQALTFREVADIIASVSGRPVLYNDIDQEAWISGALAAGVPADYAVMLRWLTGAIVTGGGSMPTDDIEKVTGREPATFRQFAERNARAWTVEAK